jgi:hypothetical protein
MKKIIGLSALILLAAAGAAAQSTISGVNYRQSQCSQQADAEDFGIHQYQHHRFVMRCNAGLPDLTIYHGD